MKKILSLIFAIVFLCACGTKKAVVDEYVTGNVMKNAFESTFTYSQFDSICKADTIPVNLTDWHIVYIRDYETREVKIQYLFIKRLGKNESIYRLETIDDSKFKITKRITY